MAIRTGESSGCLMLFVGVWSLFVLVFDGILAVQLYRQVDAGRRFVPVPATIEVSRVETRSDSDGTTYRPEVVFRYEVDGRELVGDSVSFAEWGTGSYATAARAIADFPVGARVSAFVDPDDPERAVLRVDLERFPFAVILFLVPFHCVAAGLWLFGRHVARRSTAEGLLAAVVARDDGAVAVVRPAAVSPALVFVLALGGGSFLGTFAVVFGVGFDAAPGLVLGVIGALLLVSAVAARWWRRRIESPARQTVIDGARRRLHVGGAPAGPEARLLGQDEGEAIPFDDVVALEVESHDAGEVNGRPWQRHDLMLRRTAGAPVRVTFLRGRPGAAEPVARWLRERLGLADPAGEPGS